MDLSGLSSFVNVTRVDISRAETLTGLEELAALPKLEVLNIDGPADLGELPHLPHLRTLHVNGTGTAHLDYVRGLPITDLRVDGAQLTDIAGLAELPVETLYLGGLAAEDASALQTLPRVRVATFTGANPLPSLAGLGTLQELYLTPGSWADLRCLAGAPVRVLFLDTTGVTSFAGLEQLPNLDNLALRGTFDLNTMPAGLKVERLDLNGSVDLDGIDRIEGLRELRIDAGWGHSVDLEPLAGVRSLQRLHLDVGAETDITPLRGHFGLLRITVPRWRASYVPVPDDMKELVSTN